MSSKLHSDISQPQLLEMEGMLQRDEKALQVRGVKSHCKPGVGVGGGFNNSG